MCHQSVGLLQSLIEKAGIPTVSISLLAEVTAKVAPPRVLQVDRPLGYPLGFPNDPSMQRAILKTALALLPVALNGPLTVQFTGQPGSRH
jgi:hypothetical protein